MADLVGSGMTNREAAQALFLSEKTVEGHLGRIFRKLDISSRTELAAQLGRTEQKKGEKSRDPSSCGTWALDEDSAGSRGLLRGLAILRPRGGPMASTRIRSLMCSHGRSTPTTRGTSSP